MKKFLWYVWMWLGSFVIAIWFAYWAWTLIKNITQTATKWDIVTSDWVNEVNSKINWTNYFFAKWSYYWYCVQDYFTSHDSHISWEYCRTAIYPGKCILSRYINNPWWWWTNVWNCSCESWFTLIKMWPTKRDTSLHWYTYACLKN